MFELASRLVGVYKVNHMVCFCGFFFGCLGFWCKWLIFVGGGLDEERDGGEQGLYQWEGVRWVGREGKGAGVSRGWGGGGEREGLSFFVSWRFGTERNMIWRSSYRTCIEFQVCRTKISYPIALPTITGYRHPPSP